MELDLSTYEDGVLIEKLNNQISLNVKPTSGNPVINRFDNGEWLVHKFTGKVAITVKNQGAAVGYVKITPIQVTDVAK